MRRQEQQVGQQGLLAPAGAHGRRRPRRPGCRRAGRPRRPAPAVATAVTTCPRAGRRRRRRRGGTSAGSGSTAMRTASPILGLAAAAPWRTMTRAPVSVWQMTCVSAPSSSTMITVAPMAPSSLRCSASGRRPSTTSGPEPRTASATAAGSGTDAPGKATLSVPRCAAPPAAGRAALDEHPLDAGSCPGCRGSGPRTRWPAGRRGPRARPPVAACPRS